MKEIWKDIQGFEGVYKISNHGRLMSFKSNPNGRILKNTNKTGWYLTVVLRSNTSSGSTTTRIHRLVAEYFIPNPLKLPEVNHKDMNKQNNHVDNLEWVDRKANNRHLLENKPSYIAGMIIYNKFKRPKKIVQLSMDGKVVGVYRNGMDASVVSGVCRRNILQVANKTEYKPGLTRTQAGGFIWKFLEDTK